MSRNVESQRTTDYGPGMVLGLGGALFQSSWHLNYLEVTQGKADLCRDKGNRSQRASFW